MLDQASKDRGRLDSLAATSDDIWNGYLLTQKNLSFKHEKAYKHLSLCHTAQEMFVSSLAFWAHSRKAILFTQCE